MTSRFKLNRLNNPDGVFCHPRWKRRFGNRVETDTSPSDELPNVEQPHNLERLEEVTARPYVLNNKIYPGTPACGKKNQRRDNELFLQAEDLQKRQVHLQKRICILLCTVFPLLTTVATLLRLWQVGVFTFAVQPVCPKGWHSFSSSCLSPLPVPSNWSSAVHSCGELDAQLPSINSEKLNNFLVSKFQPPIWLAARTGNRSFTWSDGEAFKFSKLNNSRNISDTSDIEKCLVLTPNGAWELHSCQLEFLTLCHKTTKKKEEKTV